MARFCKILTILLLASVPSLLTAQNKTLKPQWLKKTPVASNPSFTYEIVTADGPTLNIASDNCLSKLISGSGLENGVIAKSDYTSTETVLQNWNNGKLSEKIVNEGQTKTTAKGSEVELYIKEIDEFMEYDSQGRCHLTKLYAKSQIGYKPAFDNVSLTTQYGIHGLWRSMIVPGWGQMHKGSYAKGGVILGGTVALAGGIIFTESMRQSCMTQISQTHSSTAIKQLSANMSNWALGRNICIGTVAALYVYNLVDVLVAPGARRVVVTPGYMAVRF